MIRLRKVLLYDFIYYLIFIIAVLYFILINVFVKHESRYLGNENIIIGIITSYNIDGNLLSIDLKASENLKISYYINNKDEKEYLNNNLKLGIKINVYGKLNKPINNVLPNTFNYKKYLENKEIYWLCNAEKIEIIDNNENVFYKIKNTVITRINKASKSSNYLQTFILGNKKDINVDSFSNYQKNGVSHLFALSGMHVTLFTSFILNSLKKLKVTETKRYIIAMVFIMFYATLTNYTASILRAGLFFSILSLNKIFYTHIKPINILLLTGSILIFIKPNILNDIGFQYSFATSFGLILASSKLKSQNYILNLFKVSVVAFLFSIPISLNNFYEINLLSPFNNLVFVPIVTFIIYPLSLITFMLPFLDNVLYIFIWIMELFNNIISGITLLNIIIPKLNLVMCIIFYILLIIAISKQKKHHLIIMLLIIILNKYKLYFNPSAYVYFLDVGQGDSAIIQLPYNQEIIMIDTGGKLSISKEEWEKRNNNNRLSDNTLVFLKSIGITKIDYLILTHGDEDHLGEADNVINEFKVKNVIVNQDKLNHNELKIDNLIKVEQKIVGTKTKIKSLNNKERDNENDNSLVLLIEIYNYQMLFMGDASKKVEEHIIKENNLSIDLLKIGHHGSKTSSSERFLKEIKPITGIISSGRNNRYNHPSSEVITILDNLNIEYYNTQDTGTIIFKITPNAHSFNFTPP